MSGSVFGKIFTVSTFGESHGPGLGVVVDGCPSGLKLDETAIQMELNRRKPGTSPVSSARKEADTVELLSGVFEGKTTGTPIAMLIRNTNQHSGDYEALADIYRPGHADRTYELKYGFRDYRGGGRSSGRETVSRVAGGAVAKCLLKALGVAVQAYTLSIGSVMLDRSRIDHALHNDLNMPDPVAYKLASVLVAETKAQGDSLGGVIECVIEGLPPGIGEPVFDKLSAVLGQAVLSIGAVKGIEFGAGFNAALMTGSINNDTSTSTGTTPSKPRANHAGGMYGGLSDGSPVVFRAAVKPTPSIAATQETINKKHETVSLSIQGRHDPVIVPRAVVVVEAMAALAVADLLLQSLSSNIDRIRRILL